MKKLILVLLSLVLSINAFADCRTAIEADLVQKVKTQKRIVKAGKITTGVSFVTVGGFYGTMGVMLLGPLWAGAVIGSTFGAAVAVPVGTTFVIVNQVKKKQIKNRGQMLSIIGSGDELGNLYKRLLLKHPGLTLAEISTEIERLNSSEALCNGVVSGKRRKITTPKELRSYLEENLSVTNAAISAADPS